MPDDRLLRVDEVPPYAQTQFVLGGYPKGPPRLGLLFTIHNETANIHSHLLAAIWALWRCSLIVEYRPSAARSWCLLSSAGACICFSLSALAHTLGSGAILASQKHHRMLWNLDLLGIEISIGASLLTGLRWGYRCWPWAQAAYATIGAVLVVGAAYLSSAPFGSRGNHLFVGMSVCAVCVGAVAFLHWCAVAGAKDFADLFLPTLGMFACYALGFLFYSQKPIERFGLHQNKLYIGSHFVWHCAMVAGVALWDSSLHHLLRNNRPWDYFSECE